MKMNFRTSLEISTDILPSKFNEDDSYKEQFSEVKKLLTKNPVINNIKGKQSQI
jgi:hypothetical protein